MLFVLVMEAIGCATAWMDVAGFLSAVGPIGPGRRVSLYADDMVVFVAPVESDLRVLMAALHVFGRASGLFANLAKSVVTPLHYGEEKLQLVHDILACQIESFPCRYLGIPLSIFKLHKVDEQLLIDMVAARLPRWKGKMLNIAGRTTLA